MADELNPAALPPSAPVEAPTGNEGAWFRLSVPYLAAILLVCVYIASFQLPFVMESGRLVTLVILGAVATAIAGVSAFYLVRQLRAAVPPMVLSLGAFGFLMLVTTDFGRYGLTVIVAILVGIYLAYLENRPAVLTAEQAADEERLVLVLLAPAIFFVLAFAFAVVELTSVPVWEAALPVALVAAFVTAESVSRRPSAPAVWLLPVAAAALSLEFFVTLSFLPVQYLVNGAVAAILFSLFWHKVNDTLTPNVDCLSYRRQAALSVLLIVIILVTAQWL